MAIVLIIDFILFLGAAFYFLIQCGLVGGLKRLDRSTSHEHPFVSVIVAARNEEMNIDPLLQCLSQQTYSPYEIIIVNDRSSDTTALKIEGFRKNSSNLICVTVKSLQDDMPAKKNALRAGIEASKGEILCFTDADCLPPPSWIEKLVESFTPQVGLVVGYSPYQIPGDRISELGFLKNLFFKFIRYEEFRAALWAAGSIGWNAGWLCTGRNLAYRRKVYQEVNGYQNIKMSVSGDDDLFLQLVRRQTAWKIQYVYTSESFVPTAPPTDFWSFVEQRKRHFSAAKFFPFPTKIFFFIYHASNVLLFISPLLFFTSIISCPVAIALVSTKIVGDTVLFHYSYRTFEAASFHRSFISMEALYVLYNSLIGPLGIFRKFTWKQT